MQSWALIRNNHIKTKRVCLLFYIKFKTPSNVKYTIISFTAMKEKNAANYEKRLPVKTQCILI